MTRVLSVVALIDSPTPMAWAKQLIDRLQRRDGMDLHIVVTKPDPLEINSQRGRTDQSPASLTRRVANAILLGRIDKPLFTRNPWKPETLNLTLPLTRAEESTALPHGDVIINLTSTVLPETLLPDDGTPVWDVHVETLDARIKAALLQRASLNWVHLLPTSAATTTPHRLRSSA